jgi:hypothetical protein
MAECSGMIGVSLVLENRREASGQARKRQPVPSWPECEVQALFSNSSRPISMRRISLVPAPIS